MRIYTKSVKVLGVTRKELEALKEMVIESGKEKTLSAGHAVERALGHNQFLMLDVSEVYEPMNKSGRHPEAGSHAER